MRGHKERRIQEQRYQVSFISLIDIAFDQD